MVLFTDHTTDELKLPVPETVAEHWLVCPIGTLTALHETCTNVIDGAAVMVTIVVPYFVVSCVDVAVIVAVPDPAGVKTPALLTVPILVGLTDHVTDVLKLPVPVTVGMQEEVCVLRMDVGKQLTVTDVMVGGTVTVTVVLPDFVES